MSGTVPGTSVPWSAVQSAGAAAGASAGAGEGGTAGAVAGALAGEQAAAPFAEAAAISEGIALDAADLARDSEIAAAAAQSLADLAKTKAIEAAAGSASSAWTATEAANSAGVAAAAAAAGSNLFQTVTAGLAATAEGLTFGVQGVGASFADYYRKTSGQAVFLNALPSKDAVTALQSIIKVIEDDTGLGIPFLDGPDGNLIGYLSSNGMSATFGGIGLRRLPDGSVQVEDLAGNVLITRSVAGDVSVAGLGLGLVQSDDAYIAIVDGPDKNILFAKYRDGSSTEGGGGDSDTLTDPQRDIVRALANQQIIAKVIGPVDARRIALNGDSITDHSTDEVSPVFGWSSRGWGAWLRVLTQQRLICEPADVYAVAGSQSSTILARAATVAAGGYGWVGQLGGSINDLMNDVPADTTVTNWIAAAEVYLAAGTRYLCSPILPHPAGGWTTVGGQSEADQRAKLAYINAKLASYARSRTGVVWFDPRRQVVDPATGNLLDWATYDLVGHTSPRGAYSIGREAANAILPYLPPSTFYHYDLSDLRTAANPFGNALTNGALAGTGGTLDNRHTGVLPAGWASGLAASGIPTGGTIAWSKENPRTDGQPGELVVMTLTNVTGTGAQAQQFASQVIPLSGGRYAVGDVLEATLEVQLMPGARGILQAGLRVIENNGDTALEYRDLGSYGSNPQPPEGYSALLRVRFTVRPTAGAGTPNIDFRLSTYDDLTVSGGVNGVVKFGRASLNKVA